MNENFTQSNWHNCVKIHAGTNYANVCKFSRNYTEQTDKNKQYVHHTIDDENKLKCNFIQSSIILHHIIILNLSIVEQLRDHVLIYCE